MLDLYIYDNKIWAGTNDGLYYNQLRPSTVELIDIPDKLKLEQNYPNPFNPTTKISWQSSIYGRHTLKIYDGLGNVITTLVDEEQPAGNYDISFDASRLASGIYFYKLQIGSYIETRKMILLR